MGRYTGIALAVWIAALAAIAGLNAFVDPYGALGTNRAGLYFSTERQFKNAAAAGADTLIIGSSRATYIDPSDLPGKVFNAGWSGAAPEEFLSFLKVHMDRQTVLVGLDLFMLDANHKGGGRTEWGPLSLTRTLDYLSGVTPYSLTALWNFLSGVPSNIKPDGSRTTILRDTRDAKGIVDEGNRSYSGFEFSQERADALRQLKTLCETRGANCIVFIGPISRRTLNRMEREGALVHLERFRVVVKSIFPGVYDFSVSEFSDDSNFWNSDATHYRPETARAFLSFYPSAMARLTR